MANQQLNRINETILPATMAQIQDGIRVIVSQLPLGGDFALTVEERERLSGASVDNVILIGYAQAEANNTGAQILPGYFDQDKFSNDSTVLTQLDKIKGWLKNANRIVDDLRHLAAHEAYTSALSVYKAYKSAAADGVAGAQEGVDRMGERFEDNGPQTPPTPPTP